MNRQMTATGIAMLTLLSASPAIAQMRFEPLPQVPTVEPLYPSERPVSVTMSPAAVVQPREIARPVQIAAFDNSVAPAPVYEVPVRTASAAPTASFRKPEPAPVVPAVPGARPVAPAFAVPKPAGEIGQAVVLPANSRVVLRIDGGLSSADSHRGDTVKMTVTRDVVFAGRVVIPRGTPAYGEVSRRTGQGMFGKSGKVEITMRHVDLGGRTIPIAGAFREKGRGQAGRTILLGLLAGLNGASQVRGDDAQIDAETELEAATTDAVSFN